MSIPQSPQTSHPTVQCPSSTDTTAHTIHLIAPAAVVTAALLLHAIRNPIPAALALNNITEQGGENRGQMVELMLREVDLSPGEPWCAAYVSHIGFWSHYDPTTHISSWPPR